MPNLRLSIYPGSCSLRQVHQRSLMDRTIGQRLQEKFAVAFRRHAFVQHHYHAPISLAADQAAEALAEAQDCVRHLIAVERLIERLAARLRSGRRALQTASAPALTR